MLKLQPGDALEVLTNWAHGADSGWFGGYAYVRTETDGCIIARHVGGHLDGCESRWRADQVRLKKASHADLHAALLAAGRPKEAS